MVNMVLDDRDVRLKLDKLVKAVGDTQPVMNEIGDELMKYYGDEVFRQQGTTVNNNWKALAMTTQLSRSQRRGYYKNAPIATDKILVWTGRLQRGMAKTVEKAKLTIYNNVPYFKYHQTGQGVPKRQMLEITQKTVDTVTNTFIKYFNKAIR